MRNCLKNEKGAVLIAGMLILLVLTLIGLTAMQSSTLEEMMSRNYGSRNIAFEAAEAALREGENFLRTQVLPPFSGTSLVPASNGLYQPRIEVTALDWNDTDSVAYSGDQPAGAAAKPRYIIEELGTVNDDGEPIVPSTEVKNRVMYRVTAHGVGSQNGTVVILQTTYVH